MIGLLRHLLEGVGFRAAPNPQTRPAPQLTVGDGSMGRNPTLLPAGDIEINKRERNNITQGIDTWNGVPFRRRPARRMPRYAPPGSRWMNYEDGSSQFVQPSTDSGMLVRPLLEERLRRVI